MKFKDIPRFARTASYRINVGWTSIEFTLEQFSEDDLGCGLDLNPDFQRGHVWTPAQQTAFVEYALAGGQSGRDIYFNCGGWQSDYIGPFVIVDGLQRLTAVRGFMADKVPAYGHLYSQFEDRLGFMDVDFLFYVNNLRTRAEVLRWYVQMNSGGTPHSPEEIARVNELLQAEK